MKKIRLSDYRKSFPWIPIVGIFLTITYGLKYGDILDMKKPVQFFGSMIVQSLSICVPIIICDMLR